VRLLNPSVAQQRSLLVWWLRAHGERSKGARGLLGVGMGTPPECNPHRIDRGLVETEAVCFQAYGMPDVGMRNLDAYNQHRSGNRHCYKEGPTQGLLSESLLAARQEQGSQPRG
jgi:hypothetical protein